MYKGSLVSIEDLSDQEIEDILDLAQEMHRDIRAFPKLLSGYIMASLFLEPSTRTRGSFESAMKRLGGASITTADIRSSSMEKGESLADTIRVWSGYSDLIVMRHPWEGSARLAADYGEVPVINAGDGSHEHPTQTLSDLYTLRAEHGDLKGLRIALCGDLKHGRTIHSLTYALLRFGADIFFIPGKGLELPDHVKHKIETLYNRPIQKAHFRDLEALYGGGGDAKEIGGLIDAVYMTPSQPHQLTFSDRLEVPIGKGESLVFYVTRRQKERQQAEGSAPQTSQSYPRVDARMLRRPAFSHATIMHPLPRVDELSPEVDSDPRSRYFAQAKNGVPVRMALITLMLGKRPWRTVAQIPPPARDALVVSPEGITCVNPTCVTQQEPQSCRRQFTLSAKASPRFFCGYCERDCTPSFYGYKGKRSYYPLEEFSFQNADQLSQVYFFSDEADARNKGFTKAVSMRRRSPTVVEVQP